MKSVLISIRPQWCELIATGDKVLEIRTRRPKLETPFKCFIYQTKRPWEYKLLQKLPMLHAIMSGQGRVIGEFTCDRIDDFYVPLPANKADMDQTVLDQACMTYKQLYKYAKRSKVYAWHISNLVIHDKPKGLDRFCRACPEYKHVGYSYTCKRCSGYRTVFENLVRYHFCSSNGRVAFDDAPQSWCYVEEVIEIA